MYSDAGFTTLMRNTGDAEIVKMLIAAGADVNAANNDDAAALRYADNIESVKALIAAGADVNVRGQGITPLMYKKDAAGVKALIAAGADVNARDKSGKTPLMSAYHVLVLKMLVDAGADVDALDNGHKDILSHLTDRLGLPNIGAHAKILKNAGASLPF